METFWLNTEWNWTWNWGKKLLTLTEGNKFLAVKKITWFKMHIYLTTINMLVINTLWPFFAAYCFLVKKDKISYCGYFPVMSIIRICFTRYSPSYPSISTEWGLPMPLKAPSNTDPSSGHSTRIAYTLLLSPSAVYL